MIVILKPIFEWLIRNYVFFDNVIYNFIATVFVNEAAYYFAWKSVGNLYDLDIISGKSAGSVSHWTIRFIIFSAISCFIWLIKVIFSIPTWVWFAMLGVLSTIAISVIVWHIYIANKSKHKVKCT